MFWICYLPTLLQVVIQFFSWGLPLDFLKNFWVLQKKTLFSIRKLWSQSLSKKISDCLQILTRDWIVTIMIILKFTVLFPKSELCAHWEACVLIRTYLYLSKSPDKSAQVVFESLFKPMKGPKWTPYANDQSLVTPIIIEHDIFL